MSDEKGLGTSGQTRSDLAMDGLSEVLPPESESALPPSCDAGLDTGGLGGYFSGDAPTVTDDDRAADDDVEVVDVAAEDVGFQSEIQRAAMDFQRFAEKFHAFASQCQHRGAF